MPNTYSHSARLGASLSTTTAARRERAARALAFANVSAEEIEIEETNQASASVATVRGSGVRVLVSYETAVAYQSGAGRFVATPHGQFSRTTDKSVRNFAPAAVERVEVGEFRDRLRRALE